MGVRKDWMHFGWSRVRASSGLSLVELLVVIAIVAVLFAILMTTFAAAIRVVRSFR